jgi:hypothetical protein
MTVKIELKRPVVLGGSIFKKGVHEFSERFMDLPFVKSLRELGDLKIVEETQSVQPAPKRRRRNGKNHIAEVIDGLINPEKTNINPEVTSDGLGSI